MMALPAQSAVQATTTFTVTSTASGSDADTVNGTPHDGICADVDGNCTLRAAIEEANANAGADTIAFDIPGTGVHTITPTGPFLDGAALRVTDPVTIDGTTQPGYVDKPVIELDGSHLINLTNGLLLDNGSGGSTIRALVINGFSFAEAIEIDSDSNHIEGNYLGVDATGTAAKANGSGIGVSGSSNTIGGTSAAARNVISGNTSDGVGFGSGAGTGNLVQGNLIGTNAAGTAAIPNKVGVADGSAPGGNTIGGTAQGAGNVISGNTEFGVALDSKGDLVQGNRVGTNLDGTAPIPNGCCTVNGSGVLADGTGDTIGGTTAAARNVISGNSGNGITIGGGFLATGNKVQGNLIGTNAAGTAALPNAGAGVAVLFAAGNSTIGGPTADAGNVISGNGNSGITISGVFETPNHVQGNLIGTNAAGTAAIPNTGPGIWLVGPGRAGTIVGNLIAGNTGPGVRIDYGSPNPIESNSIYSNGGLGIDLGGDGVTPNDPGDTDTGPNEVQNFPVIDSALSDGSTATIEGSLASNASTNGITYRLEFFANDDCDQPSGFGEGKTPLGATSLTTQPGGAGSFSETFKLPADAGPVITSTATDPDGNTSEFSGCLETSSGGRIVVAKQTFPAGSTQSFAFTASYSAPGFSLTDGQSNDSGPLEPGAYSVTETPVLGWDSTASCDNGNAPGAITLAAGQTVTCTFVNTQRGLARVVKTVNGAVPVVSQSFTFQLRQGASTTAAGTVLEQVDANAGDGGIVNFTTKLVPGTTYALCEIVMPGWMTSLGPPFYVVYNPSGDNSTVCSDFTVQPGQTRTFAIDNKPPPGGLARTIGFWKNWASCASSIGKQKPVLDQTLAAAGPAGITIGTLTLHAGDCLKAIRLLNKSTVDTGKKMASDPAFNLAAQLLAAELNVVAGAGTCPAAVSAINDAQALLTAIHFNGITHDKLSAAQSSQANSLATMLDRYNNNLLC